MVRWTRAAAALAGVAAWSAAAAGQVDAFLRVRESEKPRATMALEAAIRTMSPADDGRPTVYLVTAIHIADGAFYETLQEFLDAQDVVLFEGVKPGGIGGEDASPAERRAATIAGLRFVAIELENRRADAGAYPQSLAELEAGSDATTITALRSALRDGWGREVVYRRAADGGSFELLSLGADGEPGGEGDDADVRFADQPAITAAERERTDGLQQDLADALGLKFQLASMDHNRPGWRNSDMSIGQVQARLAGPRAPGAAAERGARGEGARRRADEEADRMAQQLFSLLDGSGLQARLVKLVLKLVSVSPSTQGLVKVMLMETLTQADALLAAMPGSMGELMKVLIHDRNDVVLRDLRAIIENEPEVRTIGIIYGGGHLPDLQKRLVEELGYSPAGDRWVPAIVVDLSQAGMSAGQASMIRSMTRRTIEQQLRALNPSR